MNGAAVAAAEVLRKFRREAREWVRVIDFIGFAGILINVLNAVILNVENGMR